VPATAPVTAFVATTAAVASLRYFGKRAAANVVNSELLPADRQAEAYKRASLGARGDHKLKQDLIKHMLTCSSVYIYICVTDN